MPPPERYISARADRTGAQNGHIGTLDNQISVKIAHIAPRDD